MKVAELVQRAQAAAVHGDSEVQALALAVLELLGEDAPCGFELPKIGAGLVRIPESWGGPVAYLDARAIGRMLFRAADQAEEQAAPS